MRDDYNREKVQFEYEYQRKWDLRFLELCEHIAQWSKDPSMKFGAVIVDDDHIVVGMGYNGFPRGVHDYEQRLNTRETKLKYVVHAEQNAIYNATRSVKGCTLYVNGTFNCNECAKCIIQNGIKTVVLLDAEVPHRWRESWDVSDQMYSETKLKVRFVKKEKE